MTLVRKDIVLEPSRTTDIGLELPHIRLFYGRVLFEDARTSRKLAIGLFRHVGNFLIDGRHKTLHVKTHYSFMGERDQER